MQNQKAVPRSTSPSKLAAQRAIDAMDKEAQIPLLSTAQVAQSLSNDPHYRNANFEVRSSEIAGLGAFAIRDLVSGDTILREMPLFVSDNYNLYQDFVNLNQQTKDLALSLYISDQIKPGTNQVKGVWSTNWWDPPV